MVAQEAERQAELIARQIYAQSRPAIAAAPRGATRSTRCGTTGSCAACSTSSVGYSPHLLYALVADHTGADRAAHRARQAGQAAPAHPSLAALVALDPVSRFRALYDGRRTYEAALPLTLNGAPFGSIRLGVSTTLLRRELGASLRQSLTLAGVALPLAWLAAMVLARLTLRPVRALAGEVDRIRRGEFSAEPVPRGGDEFQELSAQLQRLGRELHADRLATLSEKAQLQHVVDQLEDGVIFLSREMRILFFNKAAEEVVGRPLEQAVGLPLAELLARLPSSAPPGRGRARAAERGIRNATLAMAVGERRRECLVSAFPVEDAREVMGVVVLLKDLESIKTVQSLVSYSAKLAALGRLTSGVAHEVKNPLNAMMIHVELLKERLEGAPEDVQKSLEVIGGEIRRLDRVVQGFLRFMRPQEVTFKAVDLNALLAEHDRARRGGVAGQRHPRRPRARSRAALDQRRRGAAPPGLPQSSPERLSGDAGRRRPHDPHGAPRSGVDPRLGSRTRASGSARTTSTRSSSSTTRRSPTATASACRSSTGSSSSTTAPSRRSPRWGAARP